MLITKDLVFKSVSGLIPNLLAHGLSEFKFIRLAISISGLHSSNYTLTNLDRFSTARYLFDPINTSLLKVDIRGNKIYFYEYSYYKSMTEEDVDEVSNSVLCTVFMYYIYLMSMQFDFCEINNRVNSVQFRTNEKGKYILNICKTDSNLDIRSNSINFILIK